MAMHAAAKAVLLLSCLAGSYAAFTYSTTINSPVTVPFDQSLRPFNEDMLLPEFDQNNLGMTPSQVHLSPAADGSMFVMWATGPYQFGNGTLTPAALTPSMVMYGTSPNALTQMATGTAETYSQIYPSTIPSVNITNASNYTSPVLHSATLANLTPNTTYYYQVGDGKTMSATYDFRSLNAAGPSYPQRILVIADWGLTQNSSSTLQHALYTAEGTPNPPVLTYVGDFCYADTWYSNGTHSGIAGPLGKSASGFEGMASGTYQPVWDAWQNFIEPLVSNVPTLTAVGNHEIEQQRDANQTTFASVQARWKTNGPSQYQDGYFYHSSNVGPVHSIHISVYKDYTPGSNQWQWLLTDLQNINRTATPWVTVSIHNPLYTTDTSYKQFEQLRVSMEPLWFTYGVDVFFYGHVHSYERTAPVHNYLIDPCGSVHLTVGDGGNGEGVSCKTGPSTLLPIQRDTLPQYADTPGFCPNVTLNTRVSFITPETGNTSDPFSYYHAALTFQADGNSTGPPSANYPKGYCYAEQPMWSQWRESSFGHGVLDVLNGTHARWQWHRNQDGDAVVADETYIVRNTTACPNRLGSANPQMTSGVANSNGLTMSIATS